MPPLSAVDAVSPAFERMKQILLPFRFKRWLKIGFIGWLAGAASGGGCNFNYRSSSGGGGSSGQDVEQTIRVFLNEHMLLVIFVVAFAVAVSLVLFYLSARFRFVLFDTVLRRDPNITRGWELYSGPAHRYLGFLICFMITFGLGLALIIGVPMWRAFKSGVFKGSNPFPALFGYLLPMIFGVLLLVIVMAVISSLLNDFMVPLLALDNLTIGGAWSRLREMMSAEPGAFIVYLLMKVALSMAFGLAVGIAMVIVILALAIPTAVVAAVLVVVLKDLGTAGLVIGILLAVVGILVGMAVILVLTMLATAPVAVFFTSYAFYFFGGRYPRLGALLWPQPPAPVAPPPGVPPPPLPGVAPAM
jgi:hypothetical protein